MHKSAPRTVARATRSSRWIVPTSLAAIFLLFLLQLSWRHEQSGMVAAADEQTIERGGQEQQVPATIPTILDSQAKQTEESPPNPTPFESNSQNINTEANPAEKRIEETRIDAKVSLPIAEESTGIEKRDLENQQSQHTDKDSTFIKPMDQQQHSLPPQQQHMMEDHAHPKRNYASKECGSKVLYANEEVENKGAILNDPERDDYMRNPCERAQNKFLIIELCETIQPTSLDIANFELFSSSPKDFRLSGSERYPTQDWALIGEFEAQDNREIQTFHIQPEHASYAKFIRLELLTHHGNEHFCTLSTFRLYGTSMVDEYEAEASSSQQSSAQETNLSDQKLTDVETMALSGNLEKHGKEEDPLYEDYENNTTGDVVGECNINDDEDGFIGKTTKKKNGELASMPSNHIVDQGDRQNETEKVDKKPEESAPSDMLKTIVELGANLKQALGQAFSKKVKNDTETATVIEENQQNVQGTRSNVSILNWSSLLRLNPASFCRLCPRNPALRQCSTICWIFFPNLGPTKMERQKLAIAKRAEKARLEFLDKVLRRQTAAFCPLPSTPMTCRRKSETAGQQQRPQQQQTTQNGQNNNGNHINGNNAVNENGNGAKQIPQQQPAQKPAINGKVVDKANLRPLPGTTTTHKESVFMKLNKRLTMLEQNMSVSSEHLSELSRRCNTVEQDAKQQERMTKTAERVAKQESQRVEEEMKQKMTELQREIRRLSQQLQAVTTAVQTGGAGGGFFYRPFLTPIHGYAASDGHCHGETCLNSGLSTIAQPLHTTSSAAFDSMPIVAINANENVDEEDIAGKDGLWTTQQVVYLCILVQIGTMIALKLFQTICDRLVPRSSKSVGRSRSQMSPAAAMAHPQQMPMTPTLIPNGHQQAPFLNNSPQYPQYSPINPNPS